MLWYGDPRWVAGSAKSCQVWRGTRVKRMGMVLGVALALVGAALLAGCGAADTD